MAPSGLSYLPDLGRCLNGEVSIVSWDEVLDCLLSANDQELVKLESFFADQHVKNLCSSPLPSFPKPSSSSKSIFDTKTASINITPSESQPFNIDEIKSDAIWLSTELNIDQIESLRIVTLEWRLRPRLRLREGFSDAELASLRDALGSEYVVAHDLVQGGGQQRSDEAFDSGNARKVRLLSLCLSEEVAMLDSFAELYQESLTNTTSSTTSSTGSGRIYSKLNLAQARSASLNELTENHISHLEKCILKLEQPPSWSVAEEFQPRLIDNFTTSVLQRVATILELLLIRIRESTSPITSEALLAWLQFAERVGYFSTFASDNLVQQAVICRIQSAASLVTLALLDPASVLSSLPDSTSKDSQPRVGNGDIDYLTDIHNIAEINDKLVVAADACNIHASPAVLAWAIIIQELKRTASAIKEMRESHHVQRAIDGVISHDPMLGRRASFGSTTSSQQASIYEEVIDKILSSSPVDDPATYLSRCAIEGCNVFAHLSLINSFRRCGSSSFLRTRYQILQELVEVSLSLFGYSPDLIATQLTLLASPADPAYFHTDLDTSSIFLNDKYLMDGFFETAVARFPYETLPFLRFCKVLATAPLFDDHGMPYIAYRLKQLDTFTQAAINGFAAYHTVREDENANLVSLHHTVGILDSMSNRMIGNGRQSVQTDVIPADSIGEVISESSPVIIRWQHQYSGLSLLGKLLDLYLSGLLGGIVSSFEQQDEVIVEVLDIFANLLPTTLYKEGTDLSFENRQQQCYNIIEEASSSLEKDSDVVQLVFEILERELQSFRQRNSTFNCRVSVACINLIIVFERFYPATVLSGLAKSSLLSTHASSDLLPSIVSAVELPTGDFPFLAACARLYSILPSMMPNGIITSGRSELVRSSRSYGSRKPQTATNVNVNASRGRAAMLSIYTEMVFGIFDAIPEWSFNSIEERSKIIIDLSDAFRSIVRSAYGVGEITGAITSLPSLYLPAANYLITALNPDSVEGTSGPLVRHLATVVMFQPPDLVAKGAQREVVVFLSMLAHDILQYGKTVMQPNAVLAVELLDAIPILLRSLLVAHPEVYRPIRLLISLLNTIEGREPSSLLGHLGSQSCICFVSLLKDLQHNHLLLDEHDRCMVWKLFSMLIKPEQQWLAVIVLTGRPPAGSRSDKVEISNKQRGIGKSMLTIALDNLSDITNQDLQTSISMLEFVVQAVQNWSWALDTLKSHREFFSTLISFVTSDKGGSNARDSALRNKIAALLTEIATHHLHHAKAVRDFNAMKTYIPLLNWLTLNAIEVSSYNASLHSNMKRNFSMKYGGVDPTMFKRSGATEEPYGDDFFYDMLIMNVCLSSEPSWASYRGEFERANENLSLVDSELLLLQQFKHLCIDHCNFFVQDREVQKSMAHIVNRCLTANTQIYPVEVIFEALFQTRADLALALVRQLVVVQAKGSDVTGLLLPAWDAVRFRCGSYEMAIANGDVPYWRSVLNVLLFALQFHTFRKPKAAAGQGSGLAVSQLDPFNDTILEIARIVVGDGLKSVVASIHEQHYSLSRSEKIAPDSLVDIRDVTLTLGLLQSMIRLPNLIQISTQLSELVIGSNLIRSCLQLYSWSHLLVARDESSLPVYSEICLQYLVMLTTLPLVAEEAAVEGVLSRLLTFRMTQNLQTIPGGVSFGDQRPVVNMLYELWAEGLLPLCLNLIHSVGGAVASEISTFLNQFPHQLKLASSAFVPKHNNTTGRSPLFLVTARAAASLALLSNILASFREAGASAAVDPTTIMILMGYDENQKALAEDVRDVLQERDVERRKRIIPVSEKEISLQRSPQGDLLEKKIVSQLENALICLGRTDEDEK